MIYKSIVDDIFILSSSKEHLQFVVDYMNKQYKCLKFTSEAENDNSFPFLDIQIGRHNHYESYLDQTYKTSLTDTLLLRCFSVCSDYTLFHL